MFGESFGRLESVPEPSLASEHTALRWKTSLYHSKHAKETALCLLVFLSFKLGLMSKNKVDRLMKRPVALPLSLPRTIPATFNGLHLKAHIN